MIRRRNDPNIGRVIAVGRFQPCPRSRQQAGPQEGMSVQAAAVWRTERMSVAEIALKAWPS
jgi:hypothetical protein